MPEIYHVVNRGVDRRTIVEDDKDRVRFVHNLFMLNNKKHVDPNHRFKHDHASRELLIRIHAWCLMPNHYHLLVSEIQEGSLSLFMRKLNMGYAKYFNEKYHRTGYLWQGVFRKINVQRDAHFLHIPYYIHLNPLDLVIPEWREGKVRDIKKAHDYLISYRWSSYIDYQGGKNFPSIIDKDLLSDVLGSPARQRAEAASLINDANVVTALRGKLEWQ